MKIRTGFVSNSSSSSFIVVGKKVKWEDITLEDFKTKNYFIPTGYNFEGTVNIHTRDFSSKEKKDLYNFLNAGTPEDVYAIYLGRVIEVITRGYDSGETIINKQNLPDCDVVIVYGEEDQHSPHTMIDIEEMIGEGDY